MKEHYYYIKAMEYGKRAQPRPLATVCLVANRGRVARGVALCSLHDPFNRQEGRRRARARALRAWYSKQDGSRHDDLVRPLSLLLPEALVLWSTIHKCTKDAVQAGYIKAEEACRLLRQDYMQKSCAHPHLTRFEKSILKEVAA